MSNGTLVKHGIVIVMAIIYATFQMMQLHERSSSRLNALEQDFESAVTLIRNNLPMGSYQVLMVVPSTITLNHGTTQRRAIIINRKISPPSIEGELYIDPTLVSQNGKKRPQRGSVKDTKNPSRSSASASAKSHPVLRFRVYHDRIYTLAKILMNQQVIYQIEEV